MREQLKICLSLPVGAGGAIRSPPDCETVVPRVSSPQDVLDFWFGRPVDEHHDAYREIWFACDAEFDAAIAHRFVADVEAARAGHYNSWRARPDSSLALILLLDQCPRNLYRGDPRAWASDEAALSVARDALDKGFDRELSRYRRAFMYMPFMHSERLEDQRRSVALFEALGEERSTVAAHRHLEIIARFGRFPHRNAVLGREATPEESAFLQEPHSSF